MAKHKEIHATFIEKKYINGIKIPVESSGMLEFVAPSTMIKKTMLPKPEMFKLMDNTITVERKGKMRSLQVEDYPELAIYFEGVRALLGGNTDDMTRLYKVCLTGSSTDWELVLHPLKEKMGLKAVSLDGDQDNVKSVKVQLEDGDYSIMYISRKDITQ